MTIRDDDPLAAAVIKAIQSGDVPGLKDLLAKHPELVNERLECAKDGTARSLLHVATDWPGHFGNGREVAAALIESRADVNARFIGQPRETPLHWAASSDDVEVLEVLLDAGADIEADGGVISGGTPLADARAFKQWQAAHMLVERGAQTTLYDEAALGLMDRIEKRFAQDPQPGADDVNAAFWNACNGGRRRAAEYLLERGAELNQVPEWADVSPLDAAQGENAELASWLRERGAKSAGELR